MIVAAVWLTWIAVQAPPPSARPVKRAGKEMDGAIRFDGAVDERSPAWTRRD